jgi:hypothetical protein
MPKVDRPNSKTSSLEKYLGIETLPDEEKQAITKRLDQLIQKAVMNTILKNLKPQDRPAFMKKVSQAGSRQDDWLIFARRKIRRLDAVVNQRIKDVLQTFKLGI